MRSIDFTQIAIRPDVCQRVAETMTAFTRLFPPEAASTAPTFVMASVDEPGFFPTLSPGFGHRRGRA